MIRSSSYNYILIKSVTNWPRKEKGHISVTCALLPPSTTVSTKSRHDSNIMHLSISQLNDWVGNRLSILVCSPIGICPSAPIVSANQKTAWDSSSRRLSSTLSLPKSVIVQSSFDSTFSIPLDSSRLMGIYVKRKFIINLCLP